MGLIYLTCQDGQDYDLVNLHNSIITVVESLAILSEEDTLLILKFVDTDAYTKLNSILYENIQNIKLDCEEECTLYFSYNAFLNIIQYVDFNTIQHIYYANKKLTLFEWIDISTIPGGGQVAITNSVSLRHVKTFCKRLGCGYELYSIET